MRLSRLALSLLAFTGLVTLSFGQKWCFVVAGDGRANGTPRPEDKDGLNVKITAEIAQAVIKERAKFLCWTGDLVYGYQKTPEALEAQLLAWRGVMQPLYDRGIKVLATRGNHDAGGTSPEVAWRKVFSGPYAMPDDGPKDEKGFTFSYTFRDVLVIGLDQYSGDVKESVNQPWLDRILARKPKPFVFAFGHEQAYMDGSHTDTLDLHPELRDRFWESLIGAGSRAYFCGHDHFYDRMLVKRQGAWQGPDMYQVTAGTSGAPFYTPKGYAGKNSYWRLKRVKNIDHTYGYVLVEIDGLKATMTFKGRNEQGEYVPMDSFSYETERRPFTAKSMIDD